MGDNAFTILPMSQTATLRAGSTYTGHITVANPADAKGAFEYVVEATPYSVVGTGYVADFATRSTSSMILDWIEIKNPTGTIPPNGVVDINFTIRVPSDAPAGGQYAALAVRSNGEAETTSGVTVTNVYEMSSVIYATVMGETVHEGEILGNEVPGFSTTTPVTVKTAFSNNGNVHESALVYITVKNALSGETIFPVGDESNRFSEVVMPGTTREATRDVAGMANLGVYEITQEVRYLGETSTVSQMVFICPIWFLVLVVATVATVIGTIIALVRRRRTRHVKF